MSEAQPQTTRVLGNKVWCPFCTKHVQLVKVTTAASTIHVEPRTIYNLVRSNKVFLLRIAQDRTLRVCTSCLDAQHRANQQHALARNEELEIHS